LDNVIGGKLDFLKMVKGENDSIYIGLRNRFIKLLEAKNPFNEILDIWEKDGIEKAMQKYYNIEKKTKKNERISVETLF
jgi:hypothetical protein